MELFPDFEYEPKPDPPLEVERGGAFPVVGEDVMAELVALAVQLRNLEPWTALSETDLMGIRDPGSGQLQLVSVLGGTGEMFALQCHLYPEGLNFWQDILQSHTPQIKPGLTNLRLLECEFVNQGEAEPEDLRIFRQFAQPSRKRKSICRFRNYEPDYLPWYFEEADARHMANVLRLFFRFFEEVLPEKDQYFSVPAKSKTLPEIPVFSLKKGGEAENPEDWKIEKEPLPSDSIIVEPPRPEEELLPDMDRYPVEDETWEIGSFFMPEPVSDGGRPYFAKTVLCLRISDTKAALPYPPFVYGGKEKNDTEALREIFARSIEHAGYIPAKIRIASETARCALLFASEKYEFELSFETQEELPEMAGEMMNSMNADSGDEFDFEETPDYGILNQVIASLPPDLITDLDETKPGQTLELLSSHLAQMERESPLQGALGEPDNIIYADFSQSHSKTELPRPRGEEHLRLRIELAGISPGIWREITIPIDATFHHLHQAIQDCFGWKNEHLYAFSIGSGKKAITVGPDDDVRETALLMEQLGPRRKKFSYTYDFGDDWIHQIQVKGIEKQDPASPHPRCLGGAEAAPPEDCGGVNGYELLRCGDHPWNDEESGQFWTEYFAVPFEPDEIQFLDPAISYEDNQMTYLE